MSLEVGCCRAARNGQFWLLEAPSLSGAEGVAWLFVSKAAVKRAPAPHR
jgi:hypothetical protein